MTYRILIDRQRHMVCVPYSVKNLHLMARALGIKIGWYHVKPYPHYDLPKLFKFTDEQLETFVVTLVSPKDIVRVCKKEEVDAEKET